MNKTKIEWCDRTWNPITGCLHGCDYCYARRISERFGQKPCENGNCVVCGDCPLKDPSFDCLRYIAYKKIHAIENPIYLYNPKRIQPYPYGFEPTFHRYRLDEPKKKNKNQNIFVCSMADLFGDWVPDEWIMEVLQTCEVAPQHNYLFLTKNPKRYINLRDSENWWFGTTCNNSADFIVPCRAVDLYASSRYHNFISLEPLQGEINGLALKNLTRFDWVIIGGESGNRKNKIIPKKEWIDRIVEQCKFEGVPVFMKDSLLPVMGEENMLREFPDKLMKSG